MAYTCERLLVAGENAREKGFQYNVMIMSEHSAWMGERAGVVLYSLWNGFCDLRELVLHQGDTESIHDLRVASRRMRATVSLFEPFIAGKTVKITSKELRRVTQELGRLRNIDEAIIYFRASANSFPALSRLLSVARDEEMKVVTDVLHSVPRGGMDKMFRKAVADLAGVAGDYQALPSYLSETSIQRYQVVYDLLLPATIPENAEIRHRLRIAIKKWRYLLETLGQVCQHDYSATLATLKDYQTVLGRLNDMVEFGALCDSLGLPQAEAENVVAALAKDSASYLAKFIEIADSRPLQYTFAL